MKCPKCQFENREGAKFCLECGKKFELKCPQCKKFLPLNAKFCDECGHDLRKRAEAIPIDCSKPQSYTPKHLKDKILTTRSSIEGERKLVTVFFADVANYTAMSGQLDPEEVHQIMDGCFKILMDEIHKYEGTINQFTGDGVMALFGAPVAHEDHAQRACYAALSIQKALAGYGEKVKKDTGLEFKMRIGLNSGHVIVGSIGDDLRMDYTAVGDTTNLSQRMENSAEPGSILVSDTTHKIVRSYFEFESKGEIEVKGKEKLEPAYKLIKSGDVKTRIGASIAKGLTRFVGRPNSMAALMETYEKTKNGLGQIVGIVGEAGVGKSRILLEFRNRLAQDEFTYLEGRCLHYGSSITYLPILSMIKSFFELNEGDGENVINQKIKEKVSHLGMDLSNSISPIQELLSLKVEDDRYSIQDPQMKRNNTFEILRDLFIRKSQRHPLVLVIEDLHWIDKTSEDFLDYFIDWLPNSQILLTLLYRPEYTHHWGSKSYYNRVGLHQLTVKSSLELIHAILGENEISPELNEIILSRAEGNPLYIEEFTQALLENGDIQKKNEKIFLTKDFSNIDIPDTIHGIIAGRIDRLDDDLKQTLQLASVIGRDFAFRVLNSVAEMNGDIASHLRNLQALEFIYEKNLFPELEYIFKHALIQEVAYNSLLIQRRKSIHENVGKAIEHIYQDRLEEFYERLAYHYAKSNNHDKAYEYLKLSGKKASRNYGNWEALSFYRQAIDIIDKMPLTDLTKREGIQIRLDLARPAMFLSYPEDSVEELKIGVKLAGEVGDVGNLAKLNGTLSHAYAIKGESTLSIEHAEACFREAQKIQDLDLMAPVARDLTSAYMFAGDFAKAVPLFSSVIPLIEQSRKCSETFGRPASVYTFLCGLAGFMMGYLGMFADAKDLCEKAFVNALHNNNLYELAYANFSSGIAAVAKGNGKPIIEYLEKCVDLLERSQMTTLLDITLANLGLGYVHHGDLMKAREYAERANATTRQAGTASGNAIPTQSCLALIYIELGELEKARACADEAVMLSNGRMVGGWEGFSYFALGSVLAGITVSHEEAAECIKKALMILERYSFKPILANGILVLGEIYEHFKQNDKALQNLKKAEQMFKEMGMDYWLAKTDIAYADLYKRKGDRSKARENMKKAIKIFTECGADGWVEKYEKELATLS